MSVAVLVKYAIALGILGLVTYTTFRGQGWWWRLSMRSRVTFAIMAVAFIVAAGFFYKSQEPAPASPKLQAPR